tara:strand:- start:17 stop:1411 length:1395 start_codon:yes stop_codon:yes gene_type:complete
MDNIIYHKNHPSLTTYPTNLTQGCINPLRRTSYKKLINISSRFRNNYSSTVPSNFYIELAESLKNVVSLKVKDVNISPSVYLINEINSSNNFLVEFFKKEPTINSNDKDCLIINNTKYKILSDYSLDLKLRGGTYEESALATQIQEALNNQAISQLGSSVSDPWFDISYNLNDGKFKIIYNYDYIGNPTISDISGVKIDFTYRNPLDISGTSIPDNSFLRNSINDLSQELFCKNYGIFNEIPSNIDKNQTTLGWILGFRGQYAYNSKLDASYSSIDCFNNKKFTDCSTRNLSRNELKKLINNKSSNRNYKQSKTNGENYINELIPKKNLLTTEPIKSFYDFFFVKPDESSMLVSNNIYSEISTNYLLLSINDFQNNHNSSFISIYEDSSLQDNNLIARINGSITTNLNSLDANIINYLDEERIYFGPTNINRLQIKLLDMFGRICDLNNGDWNLVLEAEILYDL